MNKYQKQVLRKLPKAYIERDFNGDLFVMNGDDCIVEEYFYPTTTDEETAWKYATQALRITQNFNRTHPAKMDLESFESKSNRITKRTKRSKQHVEEFNYQD